MESRTVAQVYGRERVYLMVKVKLQPTAKLYTQVRNPQFTTTSEDMPPVDVVVIPGYPSMGDYIESEDGSGRTWKVIRTYWQINTEFAIVEVE